MSHPLQTCTLHFEICIIRKLWKSKNVNIRFFCVEKFVNFEVLLNVSKYSNSYRKSILKRYAGLKFNCHFLSNLPPGIPFPIRLSILHAPITSSSTSARIRIAFLLRAFPTSPSCLKNILWLFRKHLHTCGFSRSF